MFAICTSIEFDLKKFLVSFDIGISFTKEMKEKAKFRNSKLDLSNEEEFLNQLDLSDFVNLIIANPYQFKINNDKALLLLEYFEKIIPIRNRVMHVKPFELGDRSTLSEVLEEIDKKISWINWDETTKTRNILNEDPSRLILKEYKRVLEYNPSVYHNLPEPEFDDTGYVGRKKEVKEIKELLCNRKNQIITIVGNGGMGKTAMAVKVLYDLIEDSLNPFDAVIWISLKTRTMSKGEFIAIRDSIKEIPEIFSCSEKSIITEDGLSPSQNLINFMANFKVLLVLDNLETINSEEINTFIKEIPDSSKLLITSRHGIGELEYRYKLEGMNSKDAIAFFREMSKYFGINLHAESDMKIKDVVVDHLYSNPLSIKWFITGIFNGLSEAQLLAKKNDLVEFCMSNVYEKLSETAKHILQLFLIENTELSLGEIDYFLDLDDVCLRRTINELFSTNMISIQKSNYILNDMARDYLSLYHAPDNAFVINTFGRRKDLNNILQAVRVKNENDPFNPTSLFANLDDKNRKLASYYLTSALDFSSNTKWDEAIRQVEKAINIAPNYFEVYKIKAFILANKREFYGALTNYQIALDKCETTFERATVLVLFSVFYILKLPDFPRALELIEEAEGYIPEALVIKLEKARVLMCLGKYKDAEDVLIKVEKERDKFTLKEQNMFASRYAELNRRIAETYESRDIEKKIQLYKKAVKEIEKVEKIDTKAYLVMCNILREIAYLYYDSSAMEYLEEILKKHFNSLKSIDSSNFKKMREMLMQHENLIPDNLYQSLLKYIRDYNLDANNIQETNKGIVTFIKDHYGFIANAHEKSLYFKLSFAPAGIEIGDIVSFDVIDVQRGKMAKNIQKVESEEDE
jgi:tetratricopeptide (TPR) repeat protein